MGNTAVLEVGSDRSAARAREDYVKAIHQMGTDGPVRGAALARYLGVSRVSVSKAKRVLESEGLLEASTAPSDPLRLSRRGRKLAIAMVRRHRVLETFLHRCLRVPLERVHAEAERIEHAVSDDLALRIATMLGRPRFDPHGHAIPYGDGDERERKLPSLATLTPGARARVVSMDDRDDEAVASLSAAGVLPGSPLVVDSKDGRSICVRCAKRTIRLSLRHAGMVRVAAL
jgi:DtxR family Mn-dependent transcriptional regulator